MSKHVLGRRRASTGAVGRRSLTTALAVSGLTKRYGPRTVLDGVDIAVPYGAVVCLVGPNGSGKTTLVECVEGLRRPDAGTIDILGDRYPFGRRRPARLGVQLQEDSLPARIKVGEALEFFRRLYGARRRRVGRLTALGVDELIRKPFASLSGGQKRRVVVALALVGEPQLVVLDEPLAGLDPDGQAAVLGLLRTLRSEGIGVLVTVHDLEQAARVGDRIVLLVGGRIVAAGRPGELVAALGASAVVVVPARWALPAPTLRALDIRRLVRHAGRQYAYGGPDLPHRLRAIGGLAALAAGRGTGTGPETGSGSDAGSGGGPVAELRRVGLLDVYVCGAGETVFDARHSLRGWRR